MDKRDSAMFALLVDTGLRSSELCDLRVSDLDWDNKMLTVRSGKGGKARHVPISRDALKKVWEHLHARGGLADDGFVFVSYRGGSAGEQLTRRGVYKAVSSWCKAAGVTRPQGKIGAHALRHTHGTQYIAQGGDALSLQRNLGHNSLRTASLYVGLADADASRLHNGASPYAALRRAKK
jgi:integrase